MEHSTSLQILSQIMMYKQEKGYSLSLEKQSSEIIKINCIAGLQKSTFFASQAWKRKFLKKLGFRRKFLQCIHGVFRVQKHLRTRRSHCLNLKKYFLMNYFLLIIIFWEELYSMKQTNEIGENLINYFLPFILFWEEIY